MIGKLRGVVETTAQIKARQRLTGRSGQLGYSIDSGARWDYEGSVAVSSTSFDDAEFIVTYTSNGTQPYPIVIPTFDVRINGEFDANRMAVDANSGYYEYQDSSVEVQSFDFGKPLQSLYRSETQSAWLVSLFFIGTSSGSMTVRIKPRAQSSCDGTFSVVRVS